MDYPTSMSAASCHKGAALNSTQRHTVTALFSNELRCRTWGKVVDILRESYEVMLTSLSSPYSSHFFDAKTSLLWHISCSLHWRMCQTQPNAAANPSQQDSVCCHLRGIFATHKSVSSIERVPAGWWRKQQPVGETTKLTAPHKEFFFYYKQQKPFYLVSFKHADHMSHNYDFILFC